MPASGAAKQGSPEGQRRRLAGASGVWYPRWFWPSFAAPAILWLGILFVLPFYVVVSVAFGTIDPIFRSPLPVYEPWWWSFENLAHVMDKVFGPLGATYIRTFWYVLAASAICLTLGYGVAYYVARHGGRLRTLYLVLLISPFWISYLMRMFAWRFLLTEDGYVNDLLRFLHLIGSPVNWLSGRSITVILGLVYGYIPYMILPLYAFLDRIDSSLLESGRDLGASPFRTFLRVTLPLSKPAIMAGLIIVSLPMFGDYYTNNMLSTSPATSMIGNILDDAVGSSGQGPQAAVLVLILMALLIVPMLYYLRSTAKELTRR